VKVTRRPIGRLPRPNEDLDLCRCNFYRMYHVGGWGPNVVYSLADCWQFRLARRAEQLEDRE
jgi:hypothetical protein